MKLRISPDLSLPIDVVTGTHAILGRKRTGKTYKAKILCEEMLSAHQQVVIIDPTDAWWGLRAGAGGTGDGFQITIFGGRHGDLPLAADAGVDLARAVIEDGFSAIFSLKGMSNAAEQRFCATFLETLYTDNHQRPLHIFMDEADIYAPQAPQGEEMRTLGATKKIVRRAGLDGIGITLITQRPADLAKSVLTQCDTLIALGLSHPADLKPVSDWVKVQVKDHELAAEMMEDLPDLPKGDAWVWSPHHGIRKRVTFRELSTFDSSRSPKAGEKTRKPPKRLTKVDVDRLGAVIAAAAERARENDPKSLRARVADLTRKLEAAESKHAKVIAEPAPASPAKVVERAVLKDGQLKRAELLVARVEKMVDRWDDVSANAHAAFDDVRKAMIEGIKSAMSEIATIRDAITKTKAPAPATTPAPVTARAPGPVKNVRIAANGVRVPAAAPAVSHDQGDDNGRLPPGEQAVLRALIQFPDGVERSTLTILTGYKRSTRDSYIKRLCARGFSANTPGGLVVATDAGRAALPDAEPLPVGRDLQEWWMTRLPPGERAILQVLIDAHPEAVRRDQLDETMEFSRSTRDSYLKRLAAKQLVISAMPGSVRASATLFEGV